MKSDKYGAEETCGGGESPYVQKSSSRPLLKAKVGETH